jgi:dipeptidyl aminopeptidase/acylaminoacyl peptidase
MDELQMVPIISREILFGNPEKAMTRISPDGTKISYLAPVDGVLNIWVAPAENLEEAKPVTTDTYRGIRFYFWAYTNRHILYLQDKNGDENWRLYSVNLETQETIDLTPIEGVNAQVQEISPIFPDHVLVGLNDRNPAYHDLYLITLEDASRLLVKQNDEYAGFVTDDNFSVRFAVKMTAEGGSQFFKCTPPDHWEHFMDVPMEDLISTDAVGFDKTGETLYMLDSRGRNTAALFGVGLRTGAKDLLAEDAQADISRVILHPTEKYVQAVVSNYEIEHWQVRDEAFAKSLEYLKKVSTGQIDIVSRTLDDAIWIVAFLRDNGPLVYYHYDRKMQKARFLFPNRNGLEGLPLTKLNPVVIKARDGLRLVSYYTLPFGSDSSGSGKPDHPLPMVLYVHGGPWARDSWGFNPTHQWLANRGYAVLSVNFRGSTGFGKEFTNASTLEWGSKMHADLMDAVDWAVMQGIADPQQIAIMGGSYGGYATLVGLTFTPEKFACGVDIVGPSNLITLMSTIPPYWLPQINLFTTRVGDFRTEEGKAFLRERSPLTFVDRIQRPLLIGQGANDPRVKQAESDQIVQAMREKGIPVTYVLYPDEGHGFARPENRMSFYAVAEAFLSKFIHGRYEPVGGDFAGSSITIPTGADDIPGAAQALKL